jgi:hypothetical protein
MMSAAALRAFEAEHPDDVALLVRDYVRRVECVVAIPKVNVERAIAEGNPPRWRHGDEIELHHGERRMVVPATQASSWAGA